MSKICCRKILNTIISPPSLLYKWHLQITVSENWWRMVPHYPYVGYIFETEKIYDEYYNSHAEAKYRKKMITKCKNCDLK